MAAPEHEQLRELSDQALADRYRAAWWARDVNIMDACRAEQAWRHGVDRIEPGMERPSTHEQAHGRGDTGV
jgi:hypothetical protein